MAYQFAESLGANYSFLSILNTQWQDCSWGGVGGGRKENDITGAFFMKKKTLCTPVHRVAIPKVSGSN